MFTDKESFKKEYIKKYSELIGDEYDNSNIRDNYMVLSKLISERINEIWANKKANNNKKTEKKVYYFSIEFLIGKLLKQYLINLEILDIVEEGLKELGIQLSMLEDFEEEPGLGNGGLGRLAACFLDSMAYMKIPNTGIGIRYRHGLFEQKIVDGYQIELPDNWLKYGFPWEIRRSNKSVPIKFGGNIITKMEENKLVFEHKDYEEVLAVPYDIPIVGHKKTDSINNLRLWSAEPIKDFDLKSFHEGNFCEAVSYKSSVEAISQVLYPNDNTYEGRLLRLKQEYFFVSAGIQSLINDYKRYHDNLLDLDKYIVIHINDTHPALCIPELMRILVDEENMEWDDAWNLTVKTISYTNHTILPEALERWPINMVKNLLPRIFMIIEEINRRFVEYLSDENVCSSCDKHNMEIVRDGQIHMANMAIIGSKSVNGVAKIHTKILKNEVMKDFYTIYPNKFNNKTNGIDHRRFLLQANPSLSKVIDDAIGNKWVENPKELVRLLDFLYDSGFREKVFKAKDINKVRLAQYIKKYNGIDVDPKSIFDIQVKRIHAYKRQLLNILHIMSLYNQLKDNHNLDIHPRTFIFAGKAAPGYYYAKSIIKLINSVAETINNDKDINDKLKVVFLSNFNVSLAEIIYPAADISEQISTASKEASGTGNMKFMMNGAITLGTMDGANIEILEEVGKNNMFIFGLRANEVLAYYKNHKYNSYDIYTRDLRLQRVLNQLVNGFFLDGDMHFRNIYDSLIVHNDEFFVLKDFASYSDVQCNINQKYSNKDAWVNMSINNIAHSGYFSSDRTIKQYAKEIWKI